MNGLEMSQDFYDENQKPWSKPQDQIVNGRIVKQKSPLKRNKNPNGSRVLSNYEKRNIDAGKAYNIPPGEMQGIFTQTQKSKSMGRNL
jgi:hypothetical protein